MKQLQDIFISLSDVRPFKNSTLNKISGNGSRIIVKQLANMTLPSYFKRHPGIGYYRQAQKEGRVSNAIVSLTSFPMRIGVVWLVVECLLRQTRVPSKIVIWLSRDQFSSDETIPGTLKAFPKDVVEVRMVEGDIRSHKKYWYAVEEFKDSPLILVDDDLIYDSHMIEDLEAHSSKEEKVIACSWGAQMKWNDDGTPLPYSQWGGEKPLNQVVDDFFYGSGGGTYFPVGSLAGANQPIGVIMNACPMADDIWLNAITRKNGYRTCLIRSFISMPGWTIKDNKTLHSINNGNNLNDEQLKGVRQTMILYFGTDPFLKTKFGR